MRDIHCHILPGVDDGARDLDESLAMLEAAKQAGVTSRLIGQIMCLILGVGAGQRIFYGKSHPNRLSHSDKKCVPLLTFSQVA